MPTIRLHVRARDWERDDWRARFEAELAQAQWRMISVEPPSAERSEYVCVLVLEPAEAGRNAMDWRQSN